MPTRTRHRGDPSIFIRSPLPEQLVGKPPLDGPESGRPHRGDSKPGSRRCRRAIGWPAGGPHGPATGSRPRPVEARARHPRLPDAPSTGRWHREADSRARRGPTGDPADDQSENHDDRPFHELKLRRGMRRHAGPIRRPAPTSLAGCGSLRKSRTARGFIAVFHIPSLYCNRVLRSGYTDAMEGEDAGTQLLPKRRGPLRIPARHTAHPVATRFPAPAHWWRDEIPLAAVAAGLTEVFSRNRDREDGDPVVSLSYCRHAVKRNAKRLAEMHIGQAAADPGAEPMESAGRPTPLGSRADRRGRRPARPTAVGRRGARPYRRTNRNGRPRSDRRSARRTHLRLGVGHAPRVLAGTLDRRTADDRRSGRDRGRGLHGHRGGASAQRTGAARS